MRAVAGVFFYCNHLLLVIRAEMDACGHGSGGVPPPPSGAPLWTHGHSTRSDAWAMALYCGPITRIQRSTWPRRLTSRWPGPGLPRGIVSTRAHYTVTV